MYIGDFMLDIISFIVSCWIMKNGGKFVLSLSYCSLEVCLLENPEMVLERGRVSAL